MYPFRSFWWMVIADDNRHPWMYIGVGGLFNSSAHSVICLDHLPPPLIWMVPPTGLMLLTRVHRCISVLLDQLTSLSCFWYICFIHHHQDGLVWLLFWHYSDEIATLYTTFQPHNCDHCRYDSSCWECTSYSSSWVCHHWWEGIWCYNCFYHSPRWNRSHYFREKPLRLLQMIANDLTRR